MSRWAHRRVLSRGSRWCRARASTAPEGYPGHVTFYVGVPDVEAALAKAESLGGSWVMGLEKVMEQVEIGLFHDPEGHLIGVVKTMPQS
ncbi:MAG: VOC family protein [Pseudonocardiaceae bacterium]